MTRYDNIGHINNMEECRDGEWVMYSDAIDEMTTKKENTTELDWEAKNQLSLVAKWLAVISPVVHELFLQEFGLEKGIQNEEI